MNDLLYHSIHESKYYLGYPGFRGLVTPEKIYARQRSAFSQKSNSDLFTTLTRKAYFEIDEFSSAEELRDHVYYHGTSRYIQGGLKPGAYIKGIESGGGNGGFGLAYHTISLTKNKKIASNFSGNSNQLTIHPVLVKKHATIVSMPETPDAEALENKIIDLWQQQIDAVKISDWNHPTSEQELCVLNPRALILFSGEHYPVFNLSTDNIINPDLSVFEAILSTVKNNPPPDSRNLLKIEYPTSMKENISLSLLLSL